MMPTRLHATAGSAHHAVRVPPGWDGACTAEQAIPSDLPCDRHPCVQSLSIPAPVVTPTSCTSRQEQDAPSAPQVAPWAAKAVACAPNAHVSCGRDGLLCVPEPPDRVPPPDGFRTCIFHAGDAACPEAYPVHRLFYTAAEDTRACTPCAGGEPEGASCSLMATAYSDSACQVPVASIPVSSTNAFCGVVPAGIGLGSKSIRGLHVDPGACAPSGGEPTGAVTPTGPSTFCCLR